MSSAITPRGRLPKRVYWVRRGLVLGIALLLVFGVGKLLGGTGEDSSSSATTASNRSAPEATRPTLTVGPVAPTTKLRPRVNVPLIPPNGVCPDDDVSVLPSVAKAWAGTPVVIQLRLTGTQPACTFEVSPESLVVKIASGKDRLWSSQDCPKAIPKASVVVRSGQPVEIPVTWSGRRSDQGCTKVSDWALPGFYHVYAAAYGSTATDVQFEVTKAGPVIVTRTPKPRPSVSASATPTAAAPAPASAKPTAKPSVTPSARPSKRP